MMTILFTCAGRRNYLVRYFKEELNEEGHVFAADMSGSATALAEADKAFILPSVTHDHYFERLLEVVRNNNIDVIISLNDLELPLLAEKKEEFSDEGVTVIISSPDVIDICFDKFKTNTFAEKIGLKVPPTYLDIKKVEEELEDGSLDFPLTLKPRWGSASEGLMFVDDREGFDLAYKWLSYLDQKGELGGKESDDDPGTILVQKKMVGDEYGLDVINDLEGNHISVVVKKKIQMRAGETDKSLTVRNKELEEIGHSIGKKLKHIGNLDCDLFEVEGEYYLLEMNPRFGGGYPFSHEAGINLPKAIVSWLKGEEAPSSCFEYKSELLIAKCDRLVTIS
jgi:carbamoyl-phosphate synthase large subunit